MAANSMIRSIHAARSRANMDETAFRDRLERDYGTRHVSELDGGQMRDVLKVLNNLAGPRQPSGQKGLQGPYAKLLQALWLSAWNLGIARNRADAALLAFVERQTGIMRTEFLRDAADARKAIEALKSWIAREGGVDWSAFEDPQEAVIGAQLHKLGLDWRDVSVSGQGKPAAVQAVGRVALMQQLGEQIRRAKS